MEGDLQGASIDQAMAWAYGHWNAGQLVSAELLCQQVLAAWPEHPEALHLLGLLAHTHGNLTLGIDYLRRACRTPRATATFHSNLAEMCRQARLMAEAEEAGRRAVALDPQLPEAWNNLGIVLQEAGKHEESLTCLRKVVVLCPDRAESHNNLGNTLTRMGALAEARREYEIALDLDPAYSQAQGNLAHLLNLMGEGEAAAAAVARAIEADPRNPDAYLNAAAIALGRDRWDEASHYLGVLLDFCPNHPHALRMRAHLLLEAGSLDEAEAAARQAVDAAPESGNAVEMLGLVLQAKGDEGEALAAFERAVALPMPDPEAPLLGKARLLSEAGREAEAAREIERAMAINPASANAWHARAWVKTFAAGDPDIARMERLLAEGQGGGLAAGDRIALHFALGKAMLDVGEGAAAAAHLDQGNRLKRAGFHYDVAASETWFASVAAAFTPEVMARFGGCGDPSSGPIFVVGMAEAGATEVGRWLASHSRLRHSGARPSFRRMLARVTGDDLRPLGFPAMMARLLPHDLMPLARAYMAGLPPAPTDGGKVVDAMAANFPYAGLIHLLLPEVRIIHCRRDAVDTCLACYARLFPEGTRYAYDLGELARYHAAHDALARHWRSVIPATRWLDVDYETLWQDPMGQGRRLVEFCGLDGALPTPRRARPVEMAALRTAFAGRLG